MSNSPPDHLRDDPPSANEDVAKLRLQLRDYSLAELDQAGVVNWDKDAHIVKKGPHFDEQKL